MAIKRNHDRKEYIQSSHLPFVSAVLMVALAACAPSPGGAATPAGSASPTGTSAPSATAPSGAGLCDNPLYPVVAGASWNYHGSGGPTGDYDFTSTITTIAEDGFVEEAAFAGLTKTAAWKCTPAGLALLSPGGVTGSVSTSGLTIDFTTTDYSGVTLPKIIAAGDTWTQTLTLHGESSLADGTSILADGTLSSTFKAVGIESVSVPAGTFDAMRLDVETVFIIETTVAGTTVPIELHMTGSVWYAPGVGMVKNSSNGEGVATTIILTAYAIP